VFYPHLLCAGAFSAGFVNPYSSGYSADVILCWVTLVIWVMYEAKVYSVKYGWICLVLGVVPGALWVFRSTLFCEIGKCGKCGKCGKEDQMAKVHANSIFALFMFG